MSAPTPIPPRAPSLALVASNDAVLAAQLRRMLVDLGAQVVVVASVIDAIAELHGVEFDLAFVAQSIPPRSGIDVLRVARELSPDTDVVVLLDPGQTDAPIDCVRLGAFDFLHQPLDPLELASMLERAAERRQQRTTTAMVRASRAILGGTDSRELPGLIVTLAAELLAADGIVLYRVDAAERLTVAHAYGFARERDVDDVMAIAQIGAARSENRVPLLLPDDGAPPSSAARAMGRIRSAIVCPIVLDERVVGVLAAERSRDPRPFRRADAERACVLASQIRLALDNSRLIGKTVAAERLAAIGELAAGVAHEINSPLTYVLNNCALALEEASLPDVDVASLRGMLEDVRDGAERIREIARDLRVLARGTADVEVFDLSDAVRSALRMTAPVLRESVALTTSLEAGASIRGSRGRSSQIFVNLLVNAAQAAVTCGRPVELHVETRREGDRVIAQVKDTGPGIPPENLERIFEAFFTTKPTDVGTGLGLSITRAIVADQGGVIAVASELDKGTTFTVEFPAAQPTRHSITAA